MKKQLTLEQEFDIKSFAQRVSRMSEAETKEWLVDVFTMIIMNDVIYKEAIAQKWGIK